MATTPTLKSHWEYNKTSSFSSGVVGSPTIGSYSNSVLVVIVFAMDAGSNRYATAVTQAGDSLTEIVGCQDEYENKDAHVSMWYLVNPTTGAQDISVTLNGTADRAAVHVCLLSDCNQSDLVEDYDSRAHDVSSADDTDALYVTTSNDNCYIIGACVSYSIYDTNVTSDQSTIESWKTSWTLNYISLRSTRESASSADTYDSTFYLNNTGHTECAHLVVAFNGALDTFIPQALLM